MLILWCFVPSLAGTGCRDFRGRELGIPWWCVSVPAAYIFGTVTICWAVYLFAYLYMHMHPDADSPLGAATVIACLLFIIADILMFLRIKRRGAAGLFPGHDPAGSHIFVYVFMFLTAVFFLFFFYRSFRVSDGELKVGISVFSDFAPHMGMIRPVSVPWSE